MLYEKVKEYRAVTLLVPLLPFIVSCSVFKNSSTKEYDREWKKIVSSKEWKNSLEASVQSGTSDTHKFYTVASDVEIGSERDLIGVEYDVTFRKKYHSFVLRAYFKTITQAARIDEHLTRQYELLKSEHQRNPANEDQKRAFDLEKKKYEAHRKMLEGLRSWNIFNTNRTADLDFFKREYIKKVYHLYNNDATEENIINFLIYRLADLYHYEDNTLPKVD